VSLPEHTFRRVVRYEPDPCPECKGRCCRDVDTGYRHAHADAAIHTHDCDACEDGTVPVPPPPSTLERLEAWKRGARTRTAHIDHPGSVGGPGCWTVRLYHEHGCTEADEVAYVTYDEARGGHAAYVAAAEARGVVFAARDEWDDDKGLEATILAALDAFDRGVWAKP